MAQFIYHQFSLRTRWITKGIRPLYLAICKIAHRAVAHIIVGVFYTLGIHVYYSGDICKISAKYCNDILDKRLSVLYS